jgi:hypothetical protein
MHEDDHELKGYRFMRKWISLVVAVVAVAAFTLTGTARLIAQDETPTPTLRESVILTATAFVEEDTQTDPVGTPAPPRDGEGESRSEGSVNARIIPIGEPVRDELGGERTSVRFSFRASAGTVYDISASSTDFDTYLRLYDSEDVLIAENDDGGSLTDSRISGFEATDNGTYIVEVSSFGAVQGNSPESGVFTVEVSSLELSLINFDQTIEGNLTAFSDEYVFSGNAGDTIIIHVESSAFDPYAILFYDGFEVAADDDSGGDFNPRIGPYQLMNDGLYTLSVEAFSDGEGGPYTVRIERVQSVTATLNEPITLEPTDDSTMFVTFEGSTNMLIDVTVEGADAEYTLLDPSGFEAGYGSTVDFIEINSLLLYTDGTYTLLIDQGPNPQPVTVTIATAEIPALVVGSNTVDFGSNFEQFAEVEVNEGDQLRITIVPEAPEMFWDMTLEVQVNGEYIAMISGYGGDSLTTTITFESGGTALLQMYNYGEVSSYDIRIEALEDKE